MAIGAGSVTAIANRSMRSTRQASPPAWLMNGTDCWQPLPSGTAGSAETASNLMTAPPGIALVSATSCTGHSVAFPGTLDDTSRTPSGSPLATMSNGPAWVVPWPLYRLTGTVQRPPWGTASPVAREPSTQSVQRLASTKYLVCGGVSISIRYTAVGPPPPEASKISSR